MEGKHDFTSGVEYQVIIQLRSDVSVSIFEPQLVVGVSSLLGPNDDSCSRSTLTALDVENLTVKSALDEEISCRPVKEQNHTSAVGITFTDDDFRSGILYEQAW
jgi:hypothetical protein